MRHYRDTRIQNILQVGVDLQSIGSKSYALTPTQALQALEQAEKFSDLLVLGGNVMCLRDGQIDFATESWNVPNSAPGLCLEAYRAESFRQARTYIAAFKTKTPFYYNLALSNFEELRAVIEEEEQEKELEKELIARKEALARSKISE